MSASMSGGSGGFRRRGALQQWTLHFGPNMTPMVDVVMVILIFFMASAAFMGEEWFLRAAIPVEGVPGKVARPSDFEPPPVRLNVLMDTDAQGQTVVTVLDLDHAPVDRLVERFAAFPRGKETEGIEVLIKPTNRVPYRDVVRVHESCEAAGIKKVGIGVARDGATAPSAAPIAP